MNKTIQERYFKNGRLTVIPKKEKNKLEVLNELIQLFEMNKQYNEKEINELLKNVYPDFAILRRYLVDYKYLNRTQDCMTYFVNER
ncbi:hypothetical protein GCM10007425_01350 [Lysinibacillus alkalisoli]|uniref:DUF2087 domain-containing protein n=1 Tax=Lysinibacillus alkalisoli TaxID=1911548 RepID=A0A917D6V6_9BACI|nr:DUF2087 domain-containing protein [Lysinibacillus alkalisoli]GGG10814.1 hypothetical protein GCM10007425_01350 [Lysinibacillus alkalisoli]